MLPFFKKVVEGVSSFLNAIKDFNPFGLLFAGIALKIVGGGLGTATTMMIAGKAAKSAAPGFTALGVGMKPVALGMLAIGAATAGIILSLALLFKVMADGVAIMRQ